MVLHLLLRMIHVLTTLIDAHWIQSLSIHASEVTQSTRRSCTHPHFNLKDFKIDLVCHHIPNTHLRCNHLTPPSMVLHCRSPRVSHLSHNQIEKLNYNSHIRDLMTRYIKLNITAIANLTKWIILVHRDSRKQKHLNEDLHRIIKCTHWMSYSSYINQ